ncbi:hypothetical protein KSF78_0008358 [Schistosoma japonicum]|nr:hypothetical protein KSF78_0008358 [Schistosoma japonicum]
MKCACSLSNLECISLGLIYFPLLSLFNNSEILGFRILIDSVLWFGKSVFTGKGNPVVCVAKGARKQFHLTKTILH